MSAAAFWWVNTVTVKTYQGSGAYGDLWGDPVTVNCWIEDGSKLVLNANGDEVVSTTSVHGPLDQAALFAVGSEVTNGGRTSRVISLDRFDSGSLALGVDHFVANLN